MGIFSSWQGRAGDGAKDFRLGREGHSTIDVYVNVI
jgi:hypothetical protein